MTFSPHPADWDDYSEPLARSLHSGYVATATARGDTPATNPAMVPWEELHEDLRRATIAQAADVGVKLREIGAIVVPESDATPAFAFTDQEIELLAQLEHERWMRPLLARGWVYERSRDGKHKTHPYLVEWADLSEEAREKDRRAVRTLPAVLRDAGFQILRLAPT